MALLMPRPVVDDLAPLVPASTGRVDDTLRFDLGL